MSTCHTVRFRVAATREQEARTAIDQYLSALETEGQDAGLSLFNQVRSAEETLEYVQVILCADGEACRCDAHSPATEAFRRTLDGLVSGPVERRDYAVIAEAFPD